MATRLTQSPHDEGPGYDGGRRAAIGTHFELRGLFSPFVPPTFPSLSSLFRCFITTRDLPSLPLILLPFFSRSPLFRSTFLLLVVFVISALPSFPSNLYLRSS